jgi:hypothetical protein
LKQVRIEFRDSYAGAVTGLVVLRFAWLPPSFGSIDKGRDAVGLNANARFAVMKDYHGAIFSRMGRLINVQTRTPWTTFINNDRYIKVEVEFSASLDDEFGVTTSKQQVTVSPRMWDLLREHGLPKAIEQLRNKVKEAKFQRREAALSPPAGTPRVSENAMATLASFGLGGGAQLSLPLRPQAYRVEVEHRPGSPFFRVEPDCAERVLKLNSGHRFFEDMYDGPASSPELRSALEVLLFCLGDALVGSEGRIRANQEELLLNWSRRLDDALALLEEHIGSREFAELNEAAWPEAIAPGFAICSHPRAVRRRPF